jgi:hypothetical protein
MTPGLVLAAAVGEVLGEWRRTGYYPPARCPELHPMGPELRCTYPRGHDGLHGCDGPYRDTEETAQ